MPTAVVKAIQHRLLIAERRYWELRKIQDEYRHAECNGYFESFKISPAAMRYAKAKILKTYESIKEVERRIGLYQAEIQLLRGPEKNASPIPGLKEILKRQMHEPDRFAWHFVGHVMSRFTQILCPMHLPKVLASFDTEVPKNIMRFITLEEFQVLINEPIYLIHLGQCGHCGKIYWALGDISFPNYGL